jgi:hypothetical protein
LYLLKKDRKPIRNKLSFWRSNANSSYPKGQIIEAALEFMKQSKSKDLESILRSSLQRRSAILGQTLA